VFFRDSHVDGEGRETIVHEYSSTRVGRRRSPHRRRDRRPRRRAAVAGVPQASAARHASSAHLAGLRPTCAAEFIGTTTCTHLNDVLRGLTDVDHMLDDALANRDRC
jgi:hypothetical protein